MYKISRFVRDFPTLLRTPVRAIYVFAPKIENAAIVKLHCILGYCLPIHHAWLPGELLTGEK